MVKENQCHIYILAHQFPIHKLNLYLFLFSIYISYRILKISWVVRENQCGRTGGSLHPAALQADARVKNLLEKIHSGDSILSIFLTNIWVTALQADARVGNLLRKYTVAIVFYLWVTSVQADPRVRRKSTHW